MDPLQHPKLKLSKKGSKYIFSIVNDPESNPLLTSKSFSTKSARDNAALSLGKHMDKLEKKKSNDKQYFAIKGGNKQEIAKSALFDSEEEMQIVIDFITEEFSIKADQPKVSPKKNTAKVIEQKTKAPNLPPKFSFRLEFYTPSPTEPLRGRIDYPFLKEKKTFEGIDLEVIKDFLKLYLPKEAKVNSSPDSDISSIPGTVEPSNAEKILAETANAKRDDTTVTVPISSEIDFDFINVNTGQKNNHLLNRMDNTALQLNVEGLQFSRDAYTSTAISVYSTSLESRNKMVLGQTQDSTANLKLINIPLHAQYLAGAGTYKIELVMQLVPKNKSIAPFHLIGTRAIDVY